MKRTYILLTLALVATLRSIAAEPEPILGTIISGIGKIGGDIKAGLNGAGETGIAIGEDILAGLGKAADAGAAIGDDFIATLRKATGELIDDAERNYQIIAKQIHEAFVEAVVKFAATVRAAWQQLSKRLSSVRNSIKREALEATINLLQQIDAAAAALEATIVDISALTSDVIEGQRDRVIAGWRAWADVELERVSAATNGDAAKVQRAEAILDAAIETYTARLHNCGDDVQVQVHEYKSNVAVTINQYQVSTETLIKITNNCLKSDNGNAAAQDCSTKLSAQRYELEDATTVTAELRVEGVVLSRNGFLGSDCTKKVLAQFARAKKSIDQQLKALINDDSVVSSTEGPSSESTSTTESTTPSDPNAS